MDKKKSLENLMKLLLDYQNASGQVINKRKSKCFVGGVTESRRRIIAESLQMELSEFPDKYLGVILCPGRVKIYQVWGMVELMHKMLAGWMGQMLSFSDRLTLVKSVLCSVPVYNMSVYKWPKNVIKECEKIVRNFLRSGDPAVKKLIKVKFDEIFAPVTEGGLGIRRFETINKALLMKLFWKMKIEEVERTNLMNAKYKDKSGAWITNYRKSSIWPGLKWVMNEVHEGSRWLVGDGKEISVCRDEWIKEYALTGIHPNNSFITHHKDMKVSKLIINGEWNVPAAMFNFFTLEDLPTIGYGKDKLIWTNDLSRKFSVKSAVQLIRKRYHCATWKKQCVQKRSSSVREVWFICAFTVMVELWFTGNKVCYDDEIPNLVNFKLRIMQFTKENTVRMKGKIRGFMYDMSIMTAFGIRGVKVITTEVKECIFKFRALNQVLICCDGASKGNPGSSGYGFVGRSNTGGYLGAVAGGLGVATNFIVEVMALICAGEWAIRRQYFNVCFSLDSKAILQAFSSGESGSSLRRGEVVIYDEKPGFLGALECLSRQNFL
ncbi:uncharacterized protein LOC113332928 [Papaver somniferum]|uniref:uncharacterized protein LOC113332928 n=1 Tax=Papaver somniferum TaxID=3469 RepID=UPI000E6F575F|nr:uncharacterized protein LOC113332928 [Papaver somniferum]